MTTLGSIDDLSVRMIDVIVGGHGVRLITRPGFADWEGITPAMQLLAMHAQIRAGQRILVCPGGHGALGVWAALESDARHVVVRDLNAVALDAARLTLQENGLSGLRVIGGPPCQEDEPFDVILMPASKGRALMRLLLLNAYLSLRAGGTLYLAGANRGGIKSIAQDASLLFERTQILAYKAGHRILQCSRLSETPPLFPAPFQMPGLLNGTYATWKATVGAFEYVIFSRPGVFSWEHLDDGTALLLEALRVEREDLVADVGCGYGIIGLHAAHHSTWPVILTDVDYLACECAHKTLVANGVPSAEIIHGDGLKVVNERRFSLIVSNPPFHSGHRVSQAMVRTLIRQAHKALQTGGRLMIVANRFLPYDDLMADVFGRVQRLAENGRYRVLEATKTVRAHGGRRRRGRNASGESL